MKLDTNKQLIDSSVIAARGAHYITDVKVNGNALELHAYTKVPVFGRIWSFLRHICISGNKQNQLSQQITAVKDYHQEKAEKYVERFIDSANEMDSDFDNLIKKTYDYYININEISTRLLRQALPDSFHAIALDQFDEFEEDLDGVEQNLSKGDLQSASARKEKMKALSGKIGKYIAALTHLPMMEEIEELSERLQSILAQYDTLEKIVAIMTQNSLAVEEQQKIPALSQIITQQAIGNDDATKAFDAAMASLIPHLNKQYPVVEQQAQAFRKRVRVLNKKTACEQALDNLNQQLTTSKDPALLIKDPVFNAQYQRTYTAATKYQNFESITAKFDALKDVVTFWSDYNQKTQCATITEAGLNAAGFFDRLLAGYPDKAVNLLPKLVAGDKDAVIQKVLPLIGTFKDEAAKQSLIDLANEWCSLPEFVKYRVEKTITDAKFVLGDFPTLLTKYMEALKSSDPTYVVSLDAVKQLYKVVTAIDERDVEKYSEELAALCCQFKSKIDFWNTYMTALQILPMGSIPANFTATFDALVQSHPKLALKLLTLIPEDNAKRQNLKSGSFVSYMTWHSHQSSKDLSLLIPEDEQDQKSLLASAIKLKWFGVYSVFTKVARPLACKLFANDDNIVKLLLESYGNEKPFNDVKASKEKDALLDRVCKMLKNEYTFRDELFTACAREINNQVMRDVHLEHVIMSLIGLATDYRKSDKYQKGVMIAEELGEAAKDRVFRYLALQTEIEFKDRLIYVSKISSPFMTPFGTKCPRDETLVEIVKDKNLWKSYMELEQLLYTIKNPKKYKMGFLEIIKELSRSSDNKPFAKYIADRVLDEETKALLNE